KDRYSILGTPRQPRSTLFPYTTLFRSELKAKLAVAELGGFGTFSRVELAAIGALLKYVDLTQIGKKPLIRPPKRSSADGILLIEDRKSTRLNSSHVKISYAVFCLKKKN